MAERIVSPGVFTREKDLSFLPQGIAEIGAAIIGPTVKGPAFVPTTVSNFNEFKEMFGGLSQDLYVPFTVREYLRSAGTVTVVRVLGLGGYTAGQLSILSHISGSSGSAKFKTYAVLAPNKSYPNEMLTASVATGNATEFTVSISLGGTAFEHKASLVSTSSKFVENVFAVAEDYG